MKTLLALAACALLLSGCSAPAGGHRTTGASRTYSGQQLDPPLPRPNFTLTDTDGKPYAFGRATAGRATLLFFGFTHCPDVCPTTLANIDLALSKLPVSLQEGTDVVFVTTDVKRDTGPVIAKYLAHFTTRNKAKFHGLTGTQTQVDAAQAAAHLMFVAEDGGQTHSAQVLLYGPDDLAHVQFTQSNDQVDQIVHDLPLVID